MKNPHLLKGKCQINDMERHFGSIVKLWLGNSVVP